MKPKSIFILMTLAALMFFGAACSLNESEPDAAEMANPASVHCEEQSGDLEIVTSKDGSQYGVCHFEDGSECEEWAYFHGECSPGENFLQPVIEESSMEELPIEGGSLPMQVTALYGEVISASQKGPSEAMLVLVSPAFPEIFVTGETGEIEEIILSLKDKSEPANKANFWGRLECPAMDQCLLTVSQIKVDGPGEELAPDLIEGWEGMIYSGASGLSSGADDYFALIGPASFEYGIWSMDEATNQQLESLRDSGQVVRIWGELYAGRMDWNGSQIVVTRVEVVEGE